MKALIVDDCEELRTWLAILLASKGFAVHESQNGQEALGILKDQQTTFDLLLTDFNMPKMNGLELIEEIIISNIQIKKIIVLSGLIDNEAKLKKLMSAYPHISFLHKLTTTEQLLKRIFS